jgi:molybdate transport system substrate-binding protein
MKYRLLSVLCFCVLPICLLQICASPALAATQPLRIGVASNFAKPMEALIAEYHQAYPTADAIAISIGSTGKLYAQIQQGAPLDLFFAADEERPNQLVQAGLTLGPAQPYTQGRLVFWHPKDAKRPELPNQVKQSTSIAIANPRLAPYGLAARQTLDGLGWNPPHQVSLITLENVGQTWAIVASGNASAGFVALSQIREQRLPEHTYTLVPEHLHEPIVQAAVIIGATAKPEAAAHFLNFVQSRSSVPPPELSQ